MTTLTYIATLESSQLCYVKTSPSLPLHASKEARMTKRFRGYLKVFANAETLSQTRSIILTLLPHNIVR
jgi:hypothetical protein